MPGCRDTPSCGVALCRVLFPPDLDDLVRCLSFLARVARAICSRGTWLGRGPWLDPAFHVGNPRVLARPKPGRAASQLESRVALPCARDWISSTESTSLRAPTGLSSARLSCKEELAHPANTWHSSQSRNGTMLRCHVLPSPPRNASSLH